MSMQTADIIDLPPIAHAASKAAPAKWVDYYELTKPRMNFLVVLTTMVGFYMASDHSMNWGLLAMTLLGTALTAAGASVLNQFAERAFDAMMPRTRNRPL